MDGRKIERLDSLIFAVKDRTLGAGGILRFYICRPFRGLHPLGPMILFSFFLPSRVRTQNQLTLVANTRFRPAPSHAGFLENLMSLADVLHLQRMERDLVDPPYVCPPHKLPNQSDCGITGSTCLPQLTCSRSTMGMVAYHHLYASTRSWC